MLLLALVVPWTAMAQNPQLNEGFDGSTFPPKDWSTIHVLGGRYWERKTDSYNSQPASAFVQYDNTGNGNHSNNYLVTPKLVPAEGEALNFYIKANGTWSGTTVTVELSTTTATADAFTTTLDSYTSGSISTSWTQITIPASLLESYENQEIYIAFHVDDYNGAGIYIDDVSGVSLYVPCCPNPSNLACTEYTATTATFTCSPIVSS